MRVLIFTCLLIALANAQTDKRQRSFNATQTGKKLSPHEPMAEWWFGTPEEREELFKQHDELRRSLNYTDYNFNVRATKGMLSRGYNKVRLSVITKSATRPSGVDWEYSKQFTYKWTGNFLHTSIVDVNPGSDTEFYIDGHSVKIKIPAENRGTSGVMMADVCLSYSDWCKWPKFNEFTESLNVLAADKTRPIDWWYIGGDNFYDPDGGWTEKFFNALDVNAKTCMTGMVLGNHDYWIYSSPSQGQSWDNLGVGMTQWYAQDVMFSLRGTEPYDWSWGDPSNKATWSPPHVPPENSIWWHKIGNVAILGFSGAYEWNTYESYVDQACNQMANDNYITLILVIGHWNWGNSMGCKAGMDAPGFANSMRGMASCKTISGKIKYVDGHDHCNTNFGDGFKIGGGGMAGCGDGTEGHTGLLYTKTSDQGEVWVYYIEFANPWADYYKDWINCVKSSGIDNCLDRENVKLWYNAPALSPSCQAMLSNNCVFKGQSASCGDRINWLENNQGMTWDEALKQVQEDCGKVCDCDNTPISFPPTPEPTTGPPTTPHPTRGLPDCTEIMDNSACDHDGCYSCGDRITWLESNGYTPAAAFAKVAEEFPDICACKNPPTQLFADPKEA